MSKQSVRVTDADISVRADALVPIVIALGLTDTESFWAKVKRWPTSTFDAAIAEFANSGNPERFRSMISERKRPNGHWDDFANVERELRPVAERLGHMPSIHWLWKNDLACLISAINKHGVPAKVAARLNVTYTQAKRGQYAAWKNAEAKLRDVMRDLGGTFPTQDDLKTRGLSSLTGAINVHHGGMVAARKRMGVDGGYHAIGHWDDFENVRTELERATETLGHFPGNDELRSMGMSSLSAALKKHGGITKVREKMGHGLGRGRRAWGHWADWDRAERALKSVIAELGHFPERQELSDRGLGGLYCALSEYHGGVMAVRERLGLDPGTVSKGHWQDWKNVVASVRTLERKIGRFPSYRDMRDNGQSGLVTAINRWHGGMTGLRKSLLQERDVKPMGYWRAWENVERELVAVIATLGRFPKHEDLFALKLSSLSNAINRFGNMKGVKERMGFIPIDDDTIFAHADALVPVVLRLGLDGTQTLWTPMKRRWTKRELDAALAAFSTSNSLDAFRGLLADP